MMGNMITVFIALGVLGIAGFFGYNIMIKEQNKESYADYTTNSPITGANSNNTKCYNDGEEVDCDTLNNNIDPEELLYNANNLDLQQNNVENQQNNSVNNSKVKGSYGIENDETYKGLNSEGTNNKLPNECYPKDILSPEELLPTDNNSV
jgi:hypothetical protein